MTLKLEHVQVCTDSADQEGRLVFIGDLLLAVLVRLSDQHAGSAGLWYLEAGFGLLAHKDAPFSTTSTRRCAGWRRDPGRGSWAPLRRSVMLTKVLRAVLRDDQSRSR